VSRWTPCKRGDFIRKRRRLGFEGPFAGTRHQFMIWSLKWLAIPSNTEYSVPQLRMMVREVEALLLRGISSDEWNTLWVAFAGWTAAGRAAAALQNSVIELTAA